MSMSRSAHRPPRRSSTTTRARRHRIVIVEDHEDTLALLAEVLEHDGWSVRTFAEPTRALEAIHESPPEVVLTDLHMSELSGQALARALRSDAKTARLKLVALTGSVAPNTPIRELFDAYLLKPVELPTLGPMLRALVETASGAGSAPATRPHRA
jgi:CheY-like chemotaxis protein